VQVVNAGITLGATAALLLLDSELGPASYTLRRAAALAVLAVIAAWGWTRKSPVAAVEVSDGRGGNSLLQDGSDGAAPSQESGTGISPGGSAATGWKPASQVGWRIVRWAAVIAAMAILAWAPSVPIALLGFVIALAAIEIGAGSRSAGVRLAGGLIPACLSYVAIRFMVDLVPQVGTLAEAVARGGSRYINYTRGFDVHLSFTALGGPAVGLAVLYLLWSGRRAGGIGRIIAAIIVPLAWFALLPAVTPEVAAGPIAAFSRGAYHGLFWLGVAGAVVAFLPAVAIRGESPSPALRAPSLQREGEEDPSRVTGMNARAVRSGRLPLIAAGLVAALAGVCLVGTAFIGPAAGRSVRVVNSGGLDWERPVFGQFGAFSGGMFGLWPVYCRAEGYDFSVVRGPSSVVRGSLTRTSEPGPKMPGRSQQADDGATVRQHPQPFVRSPWSVVRGSLTRKSGRDDATIGRSNKADEGTKGGTPTTDKETTDHEPRTTDKETTDHGQRTTDKEDTIEPADLEKTQVLVLINSPKIWDERERRTILDFVAHGGSLLVLGDHTDVFGLMRGFNSLLEPLGIRFRFDSAYKARESWRGCQAASSDAVAWGWDDENPGVAVGASLELSGSARPLLVGRYGFSDNGVRENVIGSYLGNYHYDQGERLGDVVLVATTTYGRGRVVVWGDTSAFQGVSSYYPAAVGPMLAWLSRPAAWTERPAVRVVAALGLLAVIAWLWLVRGGTREAAVIAVGLLLGLAVPWCLGLPHREARVTIADDMVLFDRSHLPASGHYNAKVNPIGPLYTNLLRSGFRVTEMEDWDPAAIARARGIAFVAPQRSFTAAEVKDVLDAEERGAVVILTAGQPDSAGARRLLDAHGLSLVPRPLGSVSSADPGASRRERETHPRFLDAWPIVTSEGGNPVELPGVEVIYRHGHDVVALFRRTGQGGLLLIADTRFFSDMNVKDMSGYWLGNLALIHELFQRYLGADPDAVKPLFRSPDKPQ
jgi:hypothetical protein